VQCEQRKNKRKVAEHDQGLDEQHDDPGLEQHDLMKMLGPVWLSCGFWKNCCELWAAKKQLWEKQKSVWLEQL